MFTPSKLMAFAFAATMLIPISHAVAASDEANLVDRARITVDDLKRDKEFGNAVELMRHAKGVMIVPSLIKGGFFVGGEGGEGVLLTRSAPNNWSYPAFYTLASASFGLQIGVEQAELVVFVMSDKAMDAFMHDEFKLGARGRPRHRHAGINRRGRHDGRPGCRHRRLVILERRLCRADAGRVGHQAARTAGTQPITAMPNRSPIS